MERISLKLNTITKNLLLLGVSILFSLLIFELLFRFFIPQETKRLATYDRDLGWRGQPNGTGRYIRKRDNINIPFRYNKYGFRGTNFTPKSTKATRVVIAGDSFVESLEVQYNQTFCKVFETMLNSSFKGTFEVANLSSQGYSTAQELLALKKYWNILKPDVVLLGFYTGNDFADNLRPKFAYLDDQNTLQFNNNKDSKFKAWYLTLKRWVYENSFSIFFLKNLIVSHTNINLADNARAVSSQGYTKDYDLAITKLLILKLKNLVEQNGAEFGLVIIPHKRDTSNISWLEELCSSNNIPCCNLKKVLSEKHYFDYDVHLNSVGHSISARELYNFFYKHFSKIGYIIK